MTKAPRALTLGPIGVAEAAALIAETRAAIVLRAGTWEGHDVTDFRVTQHTDYYETTGMGDAAPSYTAGLARTEVEIDLIYRDGAGLPKAGSELTIDQVFGVWQIHGRVLVTGVTVRASAAALTRMTVLAIGTGPFMVGYAEPEPPPADAVPGGRALAFGRIVEA